MRESSSASWRELLQQLGSPLARLPASTAGAEFLSARGRRGAAEALYREVAQREPDNAEAARGLARLLDLAGRSAEARELRARAVAIELDCLKLPTESRAAALAFRLAAEGLAEAPDRAPSGYLEKLFDDYAGRFDAHLTERLAYRGPRVLHELLLERAAAAPRAWSICDLGCGTGLLGPWLRPRAARLDGIDLSPAMLARAAERAVYDQLTRGDALETLAARAQHYDLIAAADVLVYFGDLRAPFAAVARALKPGGLWLFSAEKSHAPGFQLASSRRYRHHPDMLRAVANSTGFQELALRDATLRRENGRAVESLVGLFCKSARAAASYMS